MKFHQLLAGMIRRPDRRPPENRRRHDRVPAREKAVLYWKDHLGLQKSRPVTIVNVSQGGVAFSSEERIEKGQAISLTTSLRSLDCVVRHIRVLGDGYYLGAQIISSVAGSTGGLGIREVLQKLDQVRNDE